MTARAGRRCGATWKAKADVTGTRRSTSILALIKSPRSLVGAAQGRPASVAVAYPPYRSRRGSIWLWSESFRLLSRSLCGVSSCLDPCASRTVEWQSISGRITNESERDDKSRHITEHTWIVPDLGRGDALRDPRLGDLRVAQGPVIELAKYHA